MLIWWYPVKKSLETPEIEDEKHQVEYQQELVTLKAKYVVLSTSEK
jgi:hypothetical protein